MKNNFVIIIHVTIYNSYELDVHRRKVKIVKQCSTNEST